MARKTIEQLEQEIEFLKRQKAEQVMWDAAREREHELHKAITKRDAPTARGIVHALNALLEMVTISDDEAPL